MTSESSMKLSTPTIQPSTEEEQQMAPPSGATRGAEAGAGLLNLNQDRILAKYKELFAFYTIAMGDVMTEREIAGRAMDDAKAEVNPRLHQSFPPPPAAPAPQPPRKPAFDLA
jgi:hypothetical protein